MEKTLAFSEDTCLVKEREILREINSRQDRPRARPGFVEPIRNGLRKVQNLIKCRPSRMETGLAGRENGIRFQRKE